MTYTALVQFRPAYFNRTCMAHIPARWTAEVTDGLPKGKAVYSDGLSSREAAIADLIDQMKRHGLTGKLRLR